MNYKYFNKKAPGGAVTLPRPENLAARNKYAIKNDNMSNTELAKVLHKPIIKKSQEKKSTLNFYRQYLRCLSC